MAALFDLHLIFANVDSISIKKKKHLLSLRTDERELDLVQCQEDAFGALTLGQFLKERIKLQERMKD